MNFHYANSRDCDIDCIQFKLNAVIKITDHYEITDRKIRTLRAKKYHNYTNHSITNLSRSNDNNFNTPNSSNIIDISNKSKNNSKPELNLNSEE